MQPLITPARMGEIDRAASETVDVLINRAGWQVARKAKTMLDRTYGARVLVVVGKGNNGADGRAAAIYLERCGVHCHLVEVTNQNPWSSTARADQYCYDLIIDAGYGTGFRGQYNKPIWLDRIRARGTRTHIAPPVLAVDIPSGVDGQTGHVNGDVLAADATISFVSLKPGLVFEPGRSLAGSIEVVDIGLEPSLPVGWCMEQLDLQQWPGPAPTDHKWRRAVRLVGGGPLMPGAPSLAAAGALRAGAGYVGVSIPRWHRTTPIAGLPVEAVASQVPEHWADQVLKDIDRFSSLIIGPGLAVDDANKQAVIAVAATAIPMVLDAGAIDAVALDPDILSPRQIPAILTPHEGELARLRHSLGVSDPGEGATDAGPDRIESVTKVAKHLGAVVVSKGPTTVIAGPGDDPVLVSIAGDQRLATAGTGDVLAGVIGAALASGLDPMMAAGLGVELHGQAAKRGHQRGFVASDLPRLVAECLAVCRP